MHMIDANQCNMLTPSDRLQFCTGLEKRREMSKQAIREEIERLVKEALERKTVSVKQGQTRIEAKCGKCGALNRVLAPPGQVRVQYKCKECGEKQKTL